MIRSILGIALAVLVSLTLTAHVEAKTSKKKHVSTSTIVFVKKYDKASPLL